MEKKYWEGKNYSFFCNNKCEFFPCHKGINEEEFNCLFCYCPLYALGKKCGGNFRYTEKGIKDCSKCKIPHIKSNYGYIVGKYTDIVKLMGKIDEDEK